MRIVILAVAIFAVSIPQAHGQCRSCGPAPAAPAFGPTFPAFAPVEPKRCAVRGESCDCGCLSGETCRCTLAWSAENQHEGHYALLRGGKQIGSYDPARGVWRTLHGDGTWGPKQSSPPADAPPLPAEALAVTQNFGVDASKMKGEEAYTVNGKKATREQVMQAIESGIPDDAHRLRLTVIGTEADRKTVLADLDAHPALAGVKDRVLVQAYDPSHWAVAKAGFVTTGKPTVYLQQPDGKVLHRQDVYEGAEKLAEAVRKADPNYKPAADPNLNATLGGKSVLPLLLLGGIVAAAVYLRTRKV